MWLLLIHQIPPEPGYLRVKVRRRLRGIGAAPLKSTVYVLPQNDTTREAFEWLAREIRTNGGDAILCEAHFIGGLSDEDIRNLFRGERDADYAEIVRAAQQMVTEVPAENQRAQLARIRRRVTAVAELDFFDAPGRAVAEQAIADAEARLQGAEEEAVEATTMTVTDLQGKVWVTRHGVHVDRMASAWLIRRFIDPTACFRFVDPDGYHPAPGEVRFDMYEAEFTHEGDLCTFEVLCSLAAPEDAGLRAVAEIVHD
ncbi:MAG TPA: chromate resistance protein ChrB domain-containing protein, partial [Chloroflexota bacterium]|nr:chromate resistance protein ChrB domain-containing protein [Chloroflexota bacterium]